MLHFATRRRKFENIPTLNWLPRLARWTAVFFYLVVFAFLLSFMGLMSQINPAYQVPEFFLGAPDWFEYVLYLPWLMAVLAFAMLVFTVWVWGSAGESYFGSLKSLAARIHYTLLTIIAAGIVWFCFYWKLVVF